MRRFPSPAVMAPAFLTAVLALAACGAADTPPPAPAPAAQGERLILRETMIPDLKPVSAVVTTRDQGEARARIGGVLSELRVREGDLVRKGQVIAVVTDQRLALETRAYEAQAAAVQAEAVRAEADLTRVRALYDKGFYAKARLDQAEAAAKAARAQAEAAQAQGAASAEYAAQGAVLAPADGRVLKAGTPAGAVVTPGQAVAVITAGAPLLRATLPEAQAGALKVGTTVAIDLADLPGAGQGQVVQVYPAVEAGQIVADITVPGLDASLVDRRVRIRISLGERPGLVAPRRFVATRYGLDFVRVVDARGQVSETAVQIAPLADADQVEILSGVRAGDILLAPEAGR